MTPEEQASYLIESMMKTSHKLSDYSRIYHPTAKIHAIFLVDQIIKSLEEYDDRTEKYLKEEYDMNYSSYELQNMDSNFRYWEEVKRILEEEK